MTIRFNPRQYTMAAGAIPSETALFPGYFGTKEVVQPPPGGGGLRGQNDVMDRLMMG
jgi:hypothetical protein